MEKRRKVSLSLILVFAIFAFGMNYDLITGTVESIFREEVHCQVNLFRTGDVGWNCECLKWKTEGENCEICNESGRFQCQPFTVTGSKEFVEERFDYYFQSHGEGGCGEGLKPHCVAIVDKNE